MNDKLSDLELFWSAYLESIGQMAESASGIPEAWGFGDSPGMADELGRLVVQGVKSATCSLLWEYEAEDEPLPKEGELSIVLDGTGRPLCIIETTQMRIMPFDHVDAEFAYDEGEGDRSLAYWRQAHWRFFSRACQAIDRTVSPSMPLVCERFRVVYKAG
jgi:uncharacterized protein YhfF